jgi:hypothetical protein
MLIFVIVILLLLVASVFGNYNLLKQVESYETTMEIYTTRFAEQSNFHISMIEGIAGVLAKVKVIDQRGLFESDDYVGSMFKDLRDTLLTLEKYKIEEIGEDIE